MLERLWKEYFCLLQMSEQENCCLKFDHTLKKPTETVSHHCFYCAKPDRKDFVLTWNHNGMWQFDYITSIFTVEKQLKKFLWCSLSVENKKIFSKLLRTKLRSFPFLILVHDTRTKAKFLNLTLWNDIQVNILQSPPV